MLLQVDKLGIILVNSYLIFIFGHSINKLNDYRTFFFSLIQPSILWDEVNVGNELVVERPGGSGINSNL